MYPQGLCSRGVPGCECEHIPWGRGGCVLTMMYPAFTCLLPFLPRSHGGGDTASPGGRWGAALQYTCHHMCELGAFSNGTGEKGAYATEVLVCVSGEEGRGRPVDWRVPVYLSKPLGPCRSWRFPLLGCSPGWDCLSVVPKRRVCVHRRVSSWGSVCVGCPLLVTPGPGTVRSSPDPPTPQQLFHSQPQHTGSLAQ